MRLIVTESQYKSILLEEKINSIINKVENSQKNFLSHVKKIEKIFDVNLPDLKKNSLPLGGMSYLLGDFLKKDQKNIKSDDVGLIILATLLPYFSNNLETLKKLLEEIKKRNLVDIFDTCLYKFSSLKDSFENFMNSLPVPYKKDPLYYSFLLPVIPDLYFIANKSKYHIDVDELIDSNQNKELGIIVDEIINKFSD